MFAINTIFKKVCEVSNKLFKTKTNQWTAVINQTDNPTQSLTQRGGFLEVSITATKGSLENGALIECGAQLR